MRVDQTQVLEVQEVTMHDDDGWYLRIVVPDRGRGHKDERDTRLIGKPLWYQAMPFGWLALGTDNFVEQEAAYQQMLKEKQQ